MHRIEKKPAYLTKSLRSDQNGSYMSVLTVYKQSQDLDKVLLIHIVILQFYRFGSMEKEL